MHPHLALPILPNPYAHLYSAIKLIPYFVDGVQTAWEQAHIASKATECRTTTPAAQQAAGDPVAFVDYDPIMRDMALKSAGAHCRPVFQGD